MSLKKSLVLVFAVFVFCESAFVDNLSKCKINDGNCQKNLIQSIVRDTAKTGIPELEIPTYDPMHLKNVSVAILDLLDITLVEGTIKGIKDCIVQKVVTKIEKGRMAMDLLCDHISIKGQYKVFSSSPLVKTIFGGETIQGEGNGKVKLEKLALKVQLFFFVRKENDELYFTCKPEKTTLSFDIGKMTFFADSLYIGKEESSKLVTGLLNQNWQTGVPLVRKDFSAKALSYIYEILHKFFATVPAKKYIIDDLSSYVTNQ